MDGFDIHTNNTDIALATLASLKRITHHGAALEIVMSALVQAQSNERELCAKTCERYGNEHLAEVIRLLDR